MIGVDRSDTSSATTREALNDILLDNLKHIFVNYNGHLWGWFVLYINWILVSWGISGLLIISHHSGMENCMHAHHEVRDQVGGKEM